MIIDNKTTSFISKASCNRISCYFFFSVNAIKIVQKNVLILTLCKSNPRKKITQNTRAKVSWKKSLFGIRQIKDTFTFIGLEILYKYKEIFLATARLYRKTFLCFLKCILENVMIIYYVQINTLPFHCLIQQM